MKLDPFFQEIDKFRPYSLKIIMYTIPGLTMCLLEYMYPIRQGNSAYISMKLRTLFRTIKKNHIH